MERLEARAGSGLIVSAVLALALTATPLAATAGASQHRPPGKKATAIKERLDRQLVKRELDGVEVRTCRYAERRVRGKRTVKCIWRAAGVGAGDVPYRCKGSAVFGHKTRRKQGFLRISACANKARKQIPLAAEPVGEPLFGYNDEWYNNRTDADFDLLEKAGADLARSGLAWREVEHTDGAYDWGVYDRLYQRLLARGIRPVWNLGAAPCWAQASPCTTAGRPTPQHYPELARFAAEAAARYPSLAAIEIWNEPNMKKYWGSQPDPESYADMFKQVEAAVSAAAPQLPILFGALSPHAETSGGSMAAAEFLERGYRAGAVTRADAVSTHPYPGTDPGADHAEGVRKRLGDLYEVMKARDDLARPLWITEVGVSTYGKRAFSPEEQARALLQIRELVRRVPQVKVLILHRFIDAAGDNVMEPGYGSVASNGTPKPAFCSLAAARGYQAC